MCLPGLFGHACGWWYVSKTPGGMAFIDTACFAIHEACRTKLSVLPRQHNTAGLRKFAVCMDASFAYMQTVAEWTFRILSVLQNQSRCQGLSPTRRHAGHGCVAAKQRQGPQELHVDLQGEEGQAFGNLLACRILCLQYLTEYCPAD